MLTRNYCCYCCCCYCSCYWHTQMVLMISDSLCTYYSWCCCCCHWRDYWQSSWVVDVPKMLTCPRTSGCSATNCFLPATIEKCQIFSSLITITKTKFHGQKSDDAQIFLPLDIFRVSKLLISQSLLPSSGPERWPERNMNEHCRLLAAWPAEKRKWMKNVFDRFECDAYWALSGHFVRQWRRPGQPGDESLEVLFSMNGQPSWCQWWT